MRCGRGGGWGGQCVCGGGGWALKKMTDWSIILKALKEVGPQPVLRWMGGATACVKVDGWGHSLC